MPSLKRYEGYLLTDHRAGPGIPALGFPNEKVVEQATLWCSHCSTCFLPNPDRTRQRPYCRFCDCYMCDPCAASASKPDYVHRSFKEIVDLVKSGRYAVTGPMSNPVLIPLFKEV